MECYLRAALTGTIAPSLFTAATQTVLAHAAACAAVALVAQQAAKFIWLWRSQVFELRATGELLRFRLFSTFALRLCGLSALALVLTFFNEHLWTRMLCLAVAIGLELAGRYLFFASVVPKNMAAPYMRERRAA